MSIHKRKPLLRLSHKLQFNSIFLEFVVVFNDLRCKTHFCQIETGRRISYRELNELMNKYANFFSVSQFWVFYTLYLKENNRESKFSIFQSQGYKYGDVVALFMENNIEFIAAWFGLSKVKIFALSKFEIFSLDRSSLSLHQHKSQTRTTRPLYQRVQVQMCYHYVNIATEWGLLLNVYYYYISMRNISVLDSTKKEGVIANNMKVYLCDGEVPTAENLKKSLVTASENEPPNCPELNFQSECR